MPASKNSETKSRRFACDRCRIYKLRCSLNVLDMPCERCVKTGTSCTMTRDLPRHDQVAGRSATVANETDEQETPSNSFSSCQRLAPAGEGDDSLAQKEQIALSEMALDKNRDVIMLKGLDQMDFAVSDTTMDMNYASMYSDMGHYLLAQPTETGIETISSDPPSTTPAGRASFSSMSWTPRGTDEQNVGTPSQSEGAVPAAHNSHKNLLKLNLELTEERELLNTQTGLGTQEHQQSPVTRLLNQARRFRVILESMPTSPCVLSSASSSAAGVRQDQVRILHLVATYVSLVRSFHTVLLRLYQALQTWPTSQVEVMLSLPMLQFGECQLDSNPAMQVMVLMELVSNHLRRFRNLLGLSQVALSPAMGRLHHQQQQQQPESRLAVFDDPTATYLREVILLSEGMAGANGLEQQLINIIKDIQNLVNGLQDGL